MTTGETGLHEMKIGMPTVADLQSKQNLNHVIANPDLQMRTITRSTTGAKPRLRKRMARLQQIRKSLTLVCLAS